MNIMIILKMYPRTLPQPRVSMVHSPGQPLFICPFFTLHLRSPPTPCLQTRHQLLTYLQNPQCPPALRMDVEHKGTEVGILREAGEAEHFFGWLLWVVRRGMS